MALSAAQCSLQQCPDRESTICPRPLCVMFLPWVPASSQSPKMCSQWGQVNCGDSNLPIGEICVSLLALLPICLLSSCTSSLLLKPKTLTYLSLYFWNFLHVSFDCLFFIISFCTVLLTFNSECFMHGVLLDSWAALFFWTSPSLASFTCLTDCLNVHCPKPSIKDLDI